MTTDLDPPLLPSEQPPEMSPPVAYRDRSGGLMAFGVAQILLGVLCALMVGLMCLGQVIAARQGGTNTNFRMMAFSLGFYVVLTVVLVWLGLGSIRARRWARALSLVLGWCWFAAGIATIVMFVLIMPKIMQGFGEGNQGPPPAARVMMMLIPLVILGIFFILVPGSMVLFYRSKHVKATCQARNPAVCWTDACPLPVLGLSVVLGLGTVSLLMMPWAYNGVMPFFGVLLSGIRGSAMLLAVAGLWGYAAWACYRLRTVGWWVVFVTMLLYGLSNVMTFLQVDFKEMYRLMGVPEDQIQLLSQIPLFQGNGMFVVVGVMGVFFVLALGYILFVKRFFRQQP